MTARTPYSGLLRIGLAAVIWGSIPLFVRMVEVSPFVIVFWRVAFGAASVFGYLIFSGRLRELARPDMRTWLGVLALGALLAANWVLFFGAFALTRVAVVELISYAGPVFVAVLMPLAVKEGFDRRIILPLVLALGGAALIIGVGELALEGARNFWGAAMAFGTAIIYAGLMLTSKALLRTISAPALAFGEYATATILLLPAVFLLPGPSLAREWGALATLGVLHTTIAILIFLSGLRVVRPDHAAVFTYAEPVTAVIFAAIFLAEPVNWATAVGGAAVVAAGVLVARMAPSTGMEVAGVPARRTEPPDAAQRLESTVQEPRDDGDRSEP